MTVRLRQRGFTLVELLVVIAILALLLSLLMPTLRQAKVLGIRTLCSNRVRAILSGSFSYAAENRDFFPYRPSTSLPHDMRGTGFDLHTTFFQKYVPITIARTITSGTTTYQVNDPDSVMFCPGPINEVRGPNVPGWNTASGYAYQYSTYQYFNFKQAGGSLLVTLPDGHTNLGTLLRHSNAPSRYPLWSCLTVDKGSGWFLGHDVPYRHEEPSGVTGAFLSGSVGWIDWANCEPYYFANQTFWWPIPH